MKVYTKNIREKPKEIEDLSPISPFSGIHANVRKFTNVFDESTINFEKEKFEEKIQKAFGTEEDESVDMINLINSLDTNETIRNIEIQKNNKNNSYLTNENLSKKKNEDSFEIYKDIIIEKDVLEIRCNNCYQVVLIRDVIWHWNSCYFKVSFDLQDKKSITFNLAELNKKIERNLDKLKEGLIKNIEILEKESVSKYEISCCKKILKEIMLIGKKAVRDILNKIEKIEKKIVGICLGCMGNSTLPVWILGRRAYFLLRVFEILKRFERNYPGNSVQRDKELLLDFKIQIISFLSSEEMDLRDIFNKIIPKQKNSIQEEKTEKNDDFKKEFYKIAIKIKQSLHGKNPLKNLIISQLYDECLELKIPKHNWEDFLKQRFL